MDQISIYHNDIRAELAAILWSDFVWHTSKSVRLSFSTSKITALLLVKFCDKQFLLV